MALEKTFEPAAIEAKWAQHWEANGLFRPHRPDAVPYTIVNPPPNVTGALHIGHALDNTLQDVLIRYERLRGKDALWVVGMDHAGIATQMVVERQMAERQQKRTDFTRDEFVQKVWEWKAESGGAITGQLRRLGCSMDWANERFTMDDGMNRAVAKVFVDLYNTVKEDGTRLLYRDKRLVNWDPKLKTAISDLEVETVDMQGHFWRFRYPLADGVKLDDGSDHIIVATTRPETMLADMAVAVHPDDPRYKSVIGKHVQLPLTGRRVPIVADEHADPELGSGAVKITPGHDFNDFEVGKRAGIKPADMLNMFDAEARVVQAADGLIPADLIGMDRFDARKDVVARLKALGLLVPHIVADKNGDVVEHDAEPRTIPTPFGDRGGVVIEPWLTDQWYVDAATLAQPAIEAVRDGDINIVPKTWEKTWFNWLENIQPWCVSRQLWWGHQIPAWYGDDGGCYVAENEEAAQALAGDGVTLTRDPDVLDTWFSSALWPFATLGWPTDPPSPARPELVEGLSFSSPDGEGKNGASTSSAQTGLGDAGGSLLQRHYPNDVLISGFDILFFWDARMAMQGLHFMKEVPWRTLYLHGLVRAPDGQKMSKSKGNVVDPLGLIDQYGADALRFFMAAMESQGRDIKMDDARLAGYRNFATKLWNAARFCEANGIGASTTLAAPPANLAVNRWIIGEVAETVAAVDAALAAFRFDEAANAIYSFTWDRFCDWYLELIKGQIDDETRAVAGWVLDQILVMLHPFMPFVTEELWGQLGDRAYYPLITAKWPEPGAGVDAEARAEVAWLQSLITQVRATKSELGVAPSKSVTAFISRADAQRFNYLNGNLVTIKRMARLDEISVRTAEGVRNLGFNFGGLEISPDIIVDVEGEGRVQLVAEGIDGYLDFFGIIDIAAEKARLAKSLEAAAKERDALAARLANPAFTERAKPEAVDKARADHAAKAAEAERLGAALARLG